MSAGLVISFWSLSSIILAVLANDPRRKRALRPPYRQRCKNELESHDRSTIFVLLRISLNEITARSNTLERIGDHPLYLESLEWWGITMPHIPDPTA